MFYRPPGCKENGNLCKSRLGSSSSSFLWNEDLAKWERWQELARYLARNALDFTWNLPWWPTRPHMSAIFRKTAPYFEFLLKAHESTLNLLHSMSVPEKIIFWGRTPPYRLNQAEPIPCNCHILNILFFITLLQINIFPQFFQDLHILGTQRDAHSRIFNIFRYCAIIAQ